MTSFPLFAAAERDLELLRERLKTLAGELALKAGRGGVTISDVRLTAQSQGLLNGQESKEYLALLDLHSLLRDAGLVATNAYRRSNVDRAHGNLNKIHTLREFSEAVA